MKTLWFWLLVSVGAGGVQAAERNLDLDLPVSFDMVLAAAPGLVDEYVRLERDIGQLSSIQKNTLRRHRDTLATYNAYRAKAENAYNQHESFRLFRQLDQKKEQEQLRAVSQDLFLVQRKLAEAMAQLVQLQHKVRLAWIEQHSQGQAVTPSRILNGDIFVVLPSQLAEVYAFLSSLREQPAALADALRNPGVIAILPDHIREQLQFLQRGGVRLEQALARPEITNVVVGNLQPESVLVPDTEDNRVLSVYRSDTAFQAVDGGVSPIRLGSYLDARMVEMNDLVELYELPVPSRAVIEAAVPLSE